jgi:hypothetical protein
MRRVCAGVLGVMTLGVACLGTSPDYDPPAPVPLAVRPDLEQVERIKQLAAHPHANPLKSIVDALGPPERSLEETYRIGIYINSMDDLQAALRTGKLVGEQAAGLWFRGGEIQPDSVYTREHERMVRARQEVVTIVRDCLEGRCPEGGVTLSADTRSVLESTFRGNGRKFVPDPQGHLRGAFQYYNSAPRSLDLAYAPVGPGWWVMVEGDWQEMYHASLFLDLPIVPPLVFR